jgi:hypothetical protein
MTEVGSAAAPSEEAAGATAGVVFRVGGKLGAETTDALVISCSDRRYRRPMEHFLFKHLGLGNYDHIGVPGGVYMLSFPAILPKQLKLSMNMVKFLIQRHLPPRIVLVAHENCGRYREGFASWVRRPGFSLAEKQQHDLRVVAESLREAFPDLPVSAFYAYQDAGDTVAFAAVDPVEAA